MGTEESDTKAGSKSRFKKISEVLSEQLKKIIFTKSIYTQIILNVHQDYQKLYSSLPVSVVVQAEAVILPSAPRPPG